MEEFSKKIEKAADCYIGHPFEPDEDVSITMSRNSFREGAEWMYNEFLSKIPLNA